MTSPGGEIERETVKDPIAARPDLAVASSSSQAWVPFVAWAVALAVIAALSGLTAMALRSTGPAVRDAANRLEAVTAMLRPPPEVMPLPGMPPVKRDTHNEASADSGLAQAVITAPSWLRQPGGEFPERAQRRGVEYGEVELQCPVDAEGRITSCWILSESPPGAGFGQAALAGAVEARLSPRRVNGVAVPGMVRFRTRFALQ